MDACGRSEVKIRQLTLYFRYYQKMVLRFADMPPLLRQQREFKRES